MQLLLKKLVIILLGFACLLCVMLLSSVFLLMFSWETPYRIHVALTLIALYGIGLGVAWQRFNRLSAQKSGMQKSDQTCSVTSSMNSDYPRSMTMRFLVNRPALAIMLLAEIAKPAVWLRIFRPLLNLKQ